MSLLVSVVVPTYRRPQLLERCLQALALQNFPPEAYEIIVVNDGQDDPATHALVQEWQQRLQTNYTFLNSALVPQIPLTGSQTKLKAQALYQVETRPTSMPRIFYLPMHASRGPAAARNLGWSIARGEIIAFTDDDCIPEPDWLANGVSAFVDGVAGVSGRTVVPVPPNPTDNELNTTGLERSDFITANCFYRRSILEEVGGFDERFATAWREDSDLYFTLREHNYPLAWAKGAIVVHPVRPESWGASLRQQRKSFYNALLYKKHPALYWRYIQPAPPLHYYIMLLCLLVALLGVGLRQPLLAGTGVFAWLSLVILFTLHRLKNTQHTPRHILEMLLTSLFIPFLSIYWRLRGALQWRVLFL